MVGSLLGARQVNIASMSLGRDRIGGQAIAVINVDSPLPDELADELRAKPGIVWVRTVVL